MWAISACGIVDFQLRNSEYTSSNLNHDGPYKVTAAAITDACWNPSGSTVWKTDEVNARDLSQYCIPTNGVCRTETWQYATKAYFYNILLYFMFVKIVTIIINCI